jgi:hypothetical protein
VTPTGIPTLALVPGQLPGTWANTGRPVHPLDLGAAERLSAVPTALHRASDDGYHDWLDHVWPAAACTHPVRLHGTISRVDTATGEILNRWSTDDMPDRVIYKPCGNRRSRTCPGCAETYRRDAYHVIRAGLAGGKGVTPDVAGHPAVFATFTAPSFGTVHTRPVKLHTCDSKDTCRCKPQPCHARRDAGTCPHGRRIACYGRHSAGDPRLGQPICADCYDYHHHAVWNLTAGELWRRTKQDIERHLNQTARRRGLPPVRVSHGKAAEYQARGAIHFHVLLRLDGIDPDDPDRIIPPPPGLTVVDLDQAVRDAGPITCRTPEHPAKPDGWQIGWGTELDVRVISLHGTSTVTDLAVASYLAKYSTKGTEAAGHTSGRLDDDIIGVYSSPDGTHPERLIHACWILGIEPGYEGLRRWAHMLGFGGHFLTKARRYSVTFTRLRQARITYRRNQDTGPEHIPVERQDPVDIETAVTLRQLTYTGTGWHTTGDALLANTAADQARKRRETGHEEIADQYNRTVTEQAVA